MEKTKLSFEELQNKLHKNGEQAKETAMGMFDLTRRVFEHLEENGNSAYIQVFRCGLFNGKHN